MGREAAVLCFGLAGGRAAGGQTNICSLCEVMMTSLYFFADVHMRVVCESVSNDMFLHAAHSHFGSVFVAVWMSSS